MNTERKTIIAGVCRDVGLYLPDVLHAIDCIRKLVPSKVVIYEEGSSDNTSVILDQYMALYPDDVNVIHGLTNTKPMRHERIADARNFMLDYVRSNLAQFSDCQYLLLLDLDDVNAKPHVANTLEHAYATMENDESVMGVFPITRSLPYYDLWAFRHKLDAPKDFWFDLDNQGRVDTSRNVRNLINSIRESKALLNVDSAFGGAGLYRLCHLLDATIVYDAATCEHVGLHRRMAGLYPEKKFVVHPKWYVEGAC